MDTGNLNMLTLEDSEKKINLGDFADLENLVGRRLPQSFKRFYLRNNGGYIDNKHLYSGDTTYSIHGFEPVKYGESTIEANYTDFLEGYDFFRRLIPFAFDEAGNNYVLSLRLEDYGVVYLWLHEEERFLRVFESFDLFIYGLNN